MIPVTVGRGRKVHDIDADHGIRPTTLEGLAALEPVQPDGVVSYGSQTHPADGTAGMVITTAKQARSLGVDGPFGQVLASGFARVDAETINPYGCSLIYGHPHGSTGARGIVELLHALA